MRPVGARERANPRANARRHQATPSYARRLSSLVKCPLSHAQRRIERDWGQGVAGSNPAVPTGNDTFSNTLLPPSEPTKEPFACEMALLAARRSGIQASYHGIRQTSRAREADQSRGQRSLSHLGPARRAATLRTGGHGLANTGCRAAEVTERDPPRPGVGPDRRFRTASRWLILLWPSRAERPAAR